MSLRFHGVRFLAVSMTLLSCFCVGASAQDRPSLPATAEKAIGDAPSFTRKEDVIYARKDGVALTLDVFTPAKANGAAVLLLVSGGYVSAHSNIQPAFVRPFVNRGYTVFAIVHGCQPRYQVPEIKSDIIRACRFVRAHAKEYGIDPERFGVTGASAGGNLSLLLGTCGDDGKPSAVDPVERASSKVQAVACFFPPTDFLNYGAPGLEKIHFTAFDKPFRASFDYRERDSATNTLERVSDPEKLRAISKSISPAQQVTSQAPPTLIIHGDKDLLVPLQQSQLMVEKLKAAGVPCELVVKEGAAHGWVGIDKDFEKLADWFDRHLSKKAADAGGK
jgi:acetyl esterase/lipase